MAAGFTAVVFLAWRFVQREPTDEEKLVAILEEMRVAATERDLTPILEHIADDYQDASGMGRKELRAYLLGYFLGAQSISATFISRRVEVQGAAATAELRVLLRRDGAADTRRIALRFGRTGDDWKIQSSHHEPLVP